MALEREAELLAEAVTRRVELYQYGLRGVRGALLTAGEAHIDRELFRRYSLTRDIDREFPAPAASASSAGWRPPTRPGSCARRGPTASRSSASSN